MAYSILSKTIAVIFGLLSLANIFVLFITYTSFKDEINSPYDILNKLLLSLVLAISAGMLIKSNTRRSRIASWSLVALIIIYISFNSLA